MMVPLFVMVGAFILSGLGLALGVNAGSTKDNDGCFVMSVAAVIHFASLALACYAGFIG